MTSDSFSAVGATGWPALLVDRAGLIHRANAAATRSFEPMLESLPVPLSRLWPAQTSVSPETWLTQWDPTAALLRSLRLKAAGGKTMQYSAAVSRFDPPEAGQYLIQLLPDSSVAPAPTPAMSEASLLHKQKLECALQLARTVALDFNNSLTTILGHASWMLSEAEPDNPWRNSLVAVEQAAARAAEIASELGTFSRVDQGRGSQAAGDLNRLVERTVEVFKQKGGAEAVKWVLQLERRLYAVRFDEAKMQQALTKILENSVEALSERGQVTVQTRNLELEYPSQDRTAQLEPGTYVCIELADTGRGIAEADLPRAFDPFFTTKGTTGHRGLGLALAYGIITNHGGAIALSSEVGAGTSARIYLPAESTVVHEHHHETDDLRGHETVLMVDDEEMLLAMGEAVLSAHGYRVLTANSGQKALDVLSATVDRVDVMVTDLVMPGMSGRELIEHVNVFSPATRVVLTSGYVWPTGPEFNGLYLQKPFTSRELLRKVRQASASV